MKTGKKIVIGVIVYFLAWAVAVWLIGTEITKKTEGNRIAFMNRMTAQIKDTGSTQPGDIVSPFKKEDIPTEIEVIKAENLEKINNMGGDNTYYRTIKDESGQITDIVVYRYDRPSDYKIIILAEISIVVAVIPLLIFAIVVNKKILKPFREFSEYPAKLSKGLTNEGLPETKNRIFGKYVWGMNMLNDKLSSDRKQIDRLMYDRKQFISVLAHGIKTPVANIKLYSEAIETGLYRNGEADPADKKVAEKIGKNADEIAKLVGGILDDPGSLRSSFEPDISTFYLKDISDRITEDFQNRLNVINIPFEVELTGNPIVESDFEALIRCLSQLVENAIKYGDNTGIKLKLYRQDDTVFMGIVNKGATLNKEEIPFVFNCYWRGSNSKDKEGSGIGLYEARSIIKALGGDIMMKIENGETEVLIYLN
ncbi:MAG: HAMP domain-containing histidine kinase [Clostridiales bacterium]|nr:HAMP domain-containing histidine kinase [Clostridiales bacterium]